MTIYTMVLPFKTFVKFLPANLQPVSHGFVLSLGGVLQLN